MPPIAHSGHWIVDVAYVSPFIGLLIWLGYTTVRDRRAAAREQAGEGQEG